MKKLIKSRKASTRVFAMLMMVIVVIASGVALYNFVISKTQYMKNTFSAQMSRILLSSMKMNSTHIVTQLQNTGNKIVEITGAYVNGLIRALATTAELGPGSIAGVIIRGSFNEGNTYAVELLSIFNIVISFEATFQPYPVDHTKKELKKHLRAQA